METHTRRTESILLVIARVSVVWAAVATLLVLYRPTLLYARSHCGCSFLHAARLAIHRVEPQRVASSVQKLKNDGGLELWDSPLGQFWLPPHNESALRGQLSEQAEGEYVLDSLRPGAIFLDCGANIGVITRLALNHGARVVAIEPAPDNIECLRRTFTSEILTGRVLLVPKGVWDRDAFLRLGQSTVTAFDSFVMATEQSGIVLPVTTIDALVSELRLDRVDLIKMDIEGSEQKALLGAAQTIRRFHPRLEIAGHHLSDDWSAIPRIVSSFGKYRQTCRECIEFGGELRPDTFDFQ